MLLCSQVELMPLQNFLMKIACLLQRLFPIFVLYFDYSLLGFFCWWR